MEQLSGRKRTAGICRFITKSTVVVSVLCGLMTTQICFGAQIAAPEITQEAENQEAEAQTGELSPEGGLEGEGMLSPSSESSKESVFGKSQSQTAVTDEKMAALLTQLQTELPVQNGSWSVYICDLYNNSEGSINNHRMQAASLIKLFIMGAVYENYDILTQTYDQSAIDASLYSMITVSDNDAANTLTQYLGGGDSTAGMAAVNSFCEAHGYEDTSMGRMLLQSNAQGDNYTSVSDCGHFLKDIYEENYQEYPYADSMFELLAAQTKRNKIPAQLPEGVSVANKTGELSDVENDAGIIYDVENELVLVFMAESVTETGTAQSTIASVSREIYDYYNE